MIIFVLMDVKHWEKDTWETHTQKKGMMLHFELALKKSPSLIPELMLIVH